MPRLMTAYESIEIVITPRVVYIASPADFSTADGFARKLPRH
jgi:hypothetical protein